MAILSSLVFISLTLCEFAGADTIDFEVEYTCDESHSESDCSVTPEFVNQAVSNSFEGDLAQQLQLDSSDAVVEALTELFPEESQQTGAPEYESPRDVVADAATLRSWLQGMQWRTFVSQIGRMGSRRVKDVHLQYVTVTGPGNKGAMIMIPGSSENIIQYDEYIRDSVDQGYSPIYLYVHRGMGESDRLLPDKDWPPVWVEYGNDFVVDCRDFVNMVYTEVRATDQNKPINGWCHSLGCSVSLAYLIEEQSAGRQQPFNALFAVAPNIQARTDPFPYGVAVGLGKFFRAVGIGRRVAPTREKTFEQDHGFDTFPGNWLSRSYTRFRRIKDTCWDNKDKRVGNDKHLSLCTVSLTGRFASTLFQMHLHTIKPFMDAGRTLEAPPLMFLQGENEKIVSKEAQVEFCNKAARSCNLEIKANARHSLHNEVDAIRSIVLADQTAFFDAHKLNTYTGSVEATFSFVGGASRTSGSLFWLSAILGLVAFCNNAAQLN